MVKKKAVVKKKSAKKAPVDEDIFWKVRKTPDPDGLYAVTYTSDTLFKRPTKQQKYVVKKLTREETESFGYIDENNPYNKGSYALFDSTKKDPMPIDLAGSIETRDLGREESIKDISAAIMRGRSTRDRGFALADKIRQLTENTKKKQELSFILAEDENFASYIKKNHPEVKDTAAIEVIRNQLENELEVVNNNLKVLLPKDEVTIAFLKSGQAGQFFNSLIAAEEKRQNKQRGDPTFNWNAVIESAGKKDGGVVGYAEGGLTEMVSETEEVVEETPQPQPRGSLSYEELRARLPKEIPDDVIAIIAASDEALIEFSNIATQQDVDAFNTKYGVELVLPQA